MNPIAETSIAAATVQILTPYLRDGAKKFAEKAGEKIGDVLVGGAFKKGRDVYEAVLAKFHNSTASSEVLEKLHETPDDSSAQTTFQEQLAELLKKDEAFASRLSRLIKDADEAGFDALFKTDVHGNVEKFAVFGTVNGNVSF